MKERLEMTRTLRSATVCWMLVAACAMSPASVFAQETDVPDAQIEGREDSPEAVGPESTEGQEQSEASAAPTGEIPATVDEPDEQSAGDESPVEEGPMVVSGMSILGNQEAPTSLVIVPWKSSELGDAVGISTILDDSRQPVDREVFMRALRYYEIRSETNP
jgi:hypothetical protein